MQVVNPSVSFATTPQGTAVTFPLEGSSCWPTVFDPSSVGPLEYGVGGVPAGWYAPV